MDNQRIFETSALGGCVHQFSWPSRSPEGADSDRAANEATDNADLFATPILTVDVGWREDVHHTSTTSFPVRKSIRGLRHSMAAPMLPRPSTKLSVVLLDG